MLCFALFTSVALAAAGLSAVRALHPSAHEATGAVRGNQPTSPRLPAGASEGARYVVKREPASACAGVRMSRGQADIDASPPGTTFCLSGTHNWTLRPKSGDRLFGPAVLDGRHTTRYAIEALATTTKVVLAKLEVRNYRVANQQGAIFAASPLASGWILRDLRVHDNGTAGPTSSASAGGWGARLANGWRVIGGRYWNNRQGGIGGGGRSSGWVVDGVEIDHNDFTDDTYTKRNISCDFEGGGMKWISSDVTVENSSIHDNACHGLWSDINAKGMTIVRNTVYGNWDAGILIEISSHAHILRNTVYNNGSHCEDGSGQGCIWLLGAGIELNSSDHVEVGNNNVYRNVNGITGLQYNRQDGHPGLLENDYIHDNTIAGPRGRTGVAATNGSNLANRDIVFASNTFKNGMEFCHVSC
jgi:parallel beta-helix repeat protein